MSKAIAKGIINYRNKLVSSVFKNEKKIISIAPNKKNETKNKNYKGIVFKIQLLASSKSKSTRKNNFKNLDNISKFKEGKIYKYYYGNVKTYDEALTLKNEARKIGFKDAFIVAFKNEKKISIREVIGIDN